MGGGYRPRGIRVLPPPRHKISPALRLDADGQMYGVRSLELGLVDFAAGQVQDVARAHHAFPFDLRRNRVTVAMLARWRRIGNAETAPSLGSMNLYDDHIVVVPMGLERLAASEADVGIDPDAMRQASLNRIRQAAQVGDVFFDGVDDNADSLR